MTSQICDAITESLAPMGTAVLIDAVHECMSTVMVSCICRRLEKISTPRASLEMPTTASVGM